MPLLDRWMTKLHSLMLGEPPGGGALQAWGPGKVADETGLVV